MKVILLSLVLVCGYASAMDKLPMTDADAVRDVDGGSCGSMPLGNGFVGQGWLHQPIPGPVEVRMSGGGTVRQSGGKPSRSVIIDMLAGKPYFIITQPAAPGEYLEWKVPGYQWGRIPLGFQIAADYHF